MPDDKATIYLDRPRVPLHGQPVPTILQEAGPVVTPISPLSAPSARNGYSEQVERSLLDSPSYRLLRALVRYKALVADGLDRHGLHPGQEFYLAQLWREDGVTSTDLAVRTGVSAPAVTKVVGGLERAGLVHRERDDADARLVRVWLTDEGRALREPVNVIWYESERAFWGGLTDDERARVRAAVGDLLS